MDKETKITATLHITGDIPQEKLQKIANDMYSLVSNSYDEYYEWCPDAQEIACNTKIEQVENEQNEQPQLPL